MWRPVHKVTQSSREEHKHLNEDALLSYIKLYESDIEQVTYNFIKLYASDRELVLFGGKLDFCKDFANHIFLWLRQQGALGLD